jgi:catechol 2,3-dioxygenase-like lactoylglutathione lyase family enzyme
MVKKRGGVPWMPASVYSKGLSGLSVNLLVNDVAASVVFAETVLGAKAVYADPDFAVLKIDTAACIAEWILHADHTYADHPLSGFVREQDGRGIGAEFRLHGLDPDDAESRARAAGYTVLAGAADKAHGLRETYILDDDGYCWTPDRPVNA